MDRLFSYKMLFEKDSLCVLVYMFDAEGKLSTIQTVNLQAVFLHTLTIVEKCKPSFLMTLTVFHSHTWSGNVNRKKVS